MARSSSGRMRDPHSRGMGSIPIRVTDIAKWRNRYTRDAQNVVSPRTCEFDPRLGYLNIAGATGVQLAFIRPVRSAQYRDLQLDADGPVLGRDAHTSPAGCDPWIRFISNDQVRKPAKRAGREPVILWVRFPLWSLNMIPWSSGEDAWMTPRRSVVRFYPGSLLIHGL